MQCRKDEEDEKQGQRVKESEESLSSSSLLSTTRLSILLILITTTFQRSPPLHLPFTSREKREIFFSFLTRKKVCVHCQLRSLHLFLKPNHPKKAALFIQIILLCVYVDRDACVFFNQAALLPCCLVALALDIFVVRVMLFISVTRIRDSLLYGYGCTLLIHRSARVCV